MNIIHHLARHGALDEAERVLTAIEAGLDDAPIVPPAEAQRRLDALVSERPPPAPTRVLE